MKSCERCSVKIPEEYQNLLCDTCYKIIEAENLRLKAREEEERSIAEKKAEQQALAGEVPDTPPEGEVPAESQNEPLTTGSTPKSGITNPDYQENPEMEDKEQWQTNLTQLQKTGTFLWHNTLWMYEFVKDDMLKWTQGRTQWPKYIWGPMVVDVGCGAGVGTNIISQEAQFAWGIDKNEGSINFAKQFFTRELNRLYYSSEVKFDCLDFVSDTREFMKFDFIVAIEVIEHIKDYQVFLSNLVKKLGKPSSTWYISTPNRNNKHIGQKQPTNKFHVREFTSEEFHDVLSQYFDKIEFFSAAGEPTERSTTHTPILAKCQNPK